MRGSAAFVNGAFTSPEQPFRGDESQGAHMTAGPSFTLAAEFPVDRARAPAEAAGQSLGVDEALRQIPGVMASMLPAFGANGIRTVEDLAACATDDLVGWTEYSGAGVTRHPGILGDMILSRQECDALILRARVRAGWIEAAAPTS
jgi:N utilization substance protein A